MSRTLAVALAAVAAIGLRQAPFASDQASAGPGAGGVTSDNVTYIGTVPLEQGNLEPGGIHVGKYFYVTGATSFSIYDVSRPRDPRLVSRTPVGVHFENEDVSTNGEILLFSDFAVDRTLHVYDVSDKRHPQEIGRLPDAGTHTATCLFDCRWSYGSYHLVGPGGPLTGGQTVDLRDPADPRDAGDWSRRLREEGPIRTGKIHDVAEVRRGRVLVASQPMVFLDARGRVRNPELLAVGRNRGFRLHSVLWPRRGEDRFILSSFETNATPRCELAEDPADTGLGFSTWDTRGWKASGEFTPVDSYMVANGAFVDGSPPANVLGCSPHWFDVRPGFRNGGLVAAAFYDHGVRFLRVNGSGVIKEVGYFMPWGGQSSAAYWITRKIVYVVDYVRGIDILRFEGAG